MPKKIYDICSGVAIVSKQILKWGIDSRTRGRAVAFSISLNPVKKIIIFCQLYSKDNAIAHWNYLSFLF